MPLSVLLDGRQSAKSGIFAMNASLRGLVRCAKVLHYWNYWQNLSAIMLIGYTWVRTNDHAACVFNVHLAIISRFLAQTCNAGVMSNR